MSRPPDPERTQPEHFPPDPCPLCGRGRRPGARCCAALLKWIRFGPLYSSYQVTERQKWARSLGGMLESLAKIC